LVVYVITAERLVISPRIAELNQTNARIVTKTAI
jgi:hypothetical protein